MRQSTGASYTTTPRCVLEPVSGTQFLGFLGSVTMLLLLVHVGLEPVSGTQFLGSLVLFHAEKLHM